MKKRAILGINPEILAGATAVLDVAGVKVIGSMASTPSRPFVRLVIESDMLPDECLGGDLKIVSALVQAKVDDEGVETATLLRFEVCPW
jgi:hypothetical protein